ncbi:hypothetical protein GCM10025868_44240 [Angustibacter aerolatus]|uniref:Uncharacterized protein n=1 Tax=Angustibacter aerolatus TaxID=1162965 RepID=A0ABQ6JMM9_9ACTN|nr:hypothetical protein GCM10025868_44240 [Angustibacter aerolatus]
MRLIECTRSGAAPDAATHRPTPPGVGVAVGVCTQQRPGRGPDRGADGGVPQHPRAARTPVDPEGPRGDVR